MKNNLSLFLHSDFISCQIHFLEMSKLKKVNENKNPWVFLRAWWKRQPDVDHEKLSGRSRSGPDWGFHGRCRPDWDINVDRQPSTSTRLRFSSGRRQPGWAFLLVDILVNVLVDGWCPSTSFLLTFSSRPFLIAFR